MYIVHAWCPGRSEEDILELEQFVSHHVGALSRLHAQTEVG